VSLIVAEQTFCLSRNTLAGKAGIRLRQNYNRKAPRLAIQAGRHAHACQFRRMRKALRALRGYTGRVLRDIRRQLDKVADSPLRAKMLDRLDLAARLLRQTPKSTDKLCSARAARRLHLQGQGARPL
jgi:IS5 family transposase